MPHSQFREDVDYIGMLKTIMSTQTDISRFISSNWSQDGITALETFNYVFSKEFLTSSKAKQNHACCIIYDAKAKLLSARKFLIDLNQTNVEPFAFITIGYNEQTITPLIMKTLGNKVLSLKIFTDGKLVHEKHRANGIHHHTHFLVKLDKSRPVSKIIQFVYQSVSRHVLKKTFIDVKTEKTGRSYDQFLKYISGDKTDEKLHYVQLDKEWRELNNL